MRERISVLMDGEADESDLARNLVLIKSDAQLRHVWDTYHLIGDMLRGHEAPALAARVSERLAVEPTVLAPRRLARRGRIARRAFAMAAGVAGVALVVWLALPGVAPEQPQIAAAAPAAPVAPPLAVGVENYLLAHQGFSPAGAMQGVAPYMRTVADERVAREK